MFHFPRFARARLFIQRAVRRHYPPWVSPFGHLRIKAWLAAPRSLSQLPASFFASCRLGIHRVPFPAWSPSLLAPASAKTSLLEDQGPARSQNAVVNRRTAPVTLCTWFLLFLARMQLSKIANRRGGADRDRTDDFQLAKLALSQLSYGPRWLVGLDRFELSTPRLSSVCSNQLSYRPSPLQAPPDSAPRQIFQRAEGCPSGPSRLDASPRRAGLRFDLVAGWTPCEATELLRKEVIQPQVPLRLPCYDFTPVTSHSLGACLLAVGAATSGATDSHGVTGGVYKARERIHRGVLIRDY